MFITLWVCIGGGMLTLLIAAIDSKNKGACSDYKISIKGAEKNLFIDRNDIETLLKKETNSQLKGLPVASFKLRKLEEVLENNDWVNKAELYFDNQDVLHVTVTERKPVARIFTTGTTSFYIDSAGQRMPLSDKLSARVPVFTGFPDKKRLGARDSQLLLDVRSTANFIIKDAFWMSQVAQIDITADRNLEMIPLVGNHVVKLGSGEQIEAKFHRLMIFYKQVLSKTGFDRYKSIDVQYEGQVVASRFGSEKADTAQLRKNVEKLLRQSKELQEEEVRSVPKVTGRYELQADSTIAARSNNPVISEPVVDPPKSAQRSSQVSAEDRRPKAVMPKRNE